MELDKALENAEVKQLEMMLNLQFSKNMNFFESYDESLYDRFKDYEPKTVKLVIDHNRCLNLKNMTEKGNFVYPSDPMQFCEEYIEQFVKTPKYSRIGLKETLLIDEDDDIHIDTTNRAINILKDLPLRNDESALKKYDYLHINGVGMGYIVAGFLDRVDIKNLVVFEPNSDVFYSSLFLLDWGEVCGKFLKKSRDIKIIVSDDRQYYYEQLRQFFNKIGIHNLAKPYIVDHLSSVELSEITSEYLDRLRQSLSATGFLDDEQWSFAHTIENWRSEIPPLRHHSRLDGVTNPVPAFLIANGPSLDSAKEILLENRDKAIYISCGTTINTLKKMGIKPDIHIEMERRYFTYEVLEAMGDPDYFKDILFVGLNTIHPKVFTLFDKKGMAFKPNDLGTHFVSQYIEAGEHCVKLGYCNPTVGNMGLALAGAFGFENIYVFGLDMSISDEGQHHSKQSTYYEFNDEQKQKDQSDFESVATESTKGNFKESVRTLPLFKAGISSAEVAIKLNSYSRFHNLSDGAYIEGAEPLDCAELYLNVDYDTAKEARNLFEKSFGMNGLRKASDDDYSDVFRGSVKILRAIEVLFSKKITSEEEASAILDDSHEYIIKQAGGAKSQYVYSLLKGSIYSWNTLLARALHTGESAEESLATYNRVALLYVEFAQRSIAKIERSMVDVDGRAWGFKEWF